MSHSKGLKTTECPKGQFFQMYQVEHIKNEIERV